MAQADIAGLLAIGAALFIAIGDVVHQRSAHEVTDEPVGNIGLFVKLLRDRRWWLGSLVSAGGFALQAAALGMAAVLLAVASGSLWALFAVLTKGVVGELGNGFWQLVRTPELYAWVLVGARLSLGSSQRSEPVH